MQQSLDNLGVWKAPDSWPQSAARDRAYQVFQSLDEMDVTALGAQADGSIPYLRFSPDAQAVADEWRDEWEQRLRGDSLKDMPVLAAHLGKYRSLMPSLALIFHLIAYVSSGSSSYGDAEKKFSEVGLEEVVLACEWCNYLEQHAQRVYQAEVSPGLDTAHRLAEKVQRGRIQHGESVRGIYRHEWSGLTTNSQVMRGLEDLESAGWVRVVSHQPPGGPGAPTQVVHLHPALRGKKEWLNLKCGGLKKFSGIPLWMTRWMTRQN
jgi:hypothetical protein